MSLDPKDINELRRLAGLPLAKFRTYYNLAGPNRYMAEGRVNGDTKFLIEMDQGDYAKSLQEIQDEKKRYEMLLDLYNEKKEKERKKSDDETD